MFIPSILLSLHSHQSNGILLFIGLLFSILSIIIFLNRLFRYNKKRNEIKSLKSFHGYNHQVSLKYRPNYMSAFIFKYNNRNLDDTVFVLFLTSMKTVSFI